MPSAVLAPVDMPPCILHRPFGMAADRQGVPLRVLTPHPGRVVPVALAIAVLKRAAGPRRVGCMGHFRSRPLVLGAPTLHAPPRPLQRAQVTRRFESEA